MPSRAPAIMPMTATGHDSASIEPAVIPCPMVAAAGEDAARAHQPRTDEVTPHFAVVVERFPAKLAGKQRGEIRTEHGADHAANAEIGKGLHVRSPANTALPTVDTEVRLCGRAGPANSSCSSERQDPSRRPQKPEHDAGGEQPRRAPQPYVAHSKQAQQKA